ncbi:MAG TPA: HEXXH motif-containing putative peptide modification protein, partial [Candidatus Polarisedimenticolia bacterium]|nr:HEXXH motif-containing putative peptide modification protein [Candidatus Polarisedimenticolia bacterium]
LARGLALLRRAWPEAEEEVRRRTWLIVPLVEPGTVSYSHLARPGISYLNVFRGSLVDLADDLLHETAHHRLHAWQETIRFSSLDEERRYFSPWRRAQRPLNGILHGTYTFLFRTELLLRLSRDAALSSARRRRLRREAAIEMRHCRMALADLTRAGRGGELTGHGRELLRSMARRLRSLRAGRLSGRFEIGIF